MSVVVPNVLILVVLPVLFLGLTVFVLFVFVGGVLYFFLVLVSNSKEKNVSVVVPIVLVLVVLLVLFLVLTVFVLVVLVGNLKEKMCLWLSLSYSLF